MRSYKSLFLISLTFVLLFYGLASAQPDPKITEVTIKPAENSIEFGQSFIITVRAKNNGDDAYHDSTLTLSFPNLEQVDDKAQIEIVDHDFPMEKAGWYIETKVKGERIHNKDLQPVEAKYLLLEGGTVGKTGDESPVWPSGKEHFLKVKVTPEDPGKFPINVRATLTGNLEKGAKRYTAPGTSTTTDQQGYKVTRLMQTITPQVQFSASNGDEGGVNLRWLIDANYYEDIRICGNPVLYPKDAMKCVNYMNLSKSKAQKGIYQAPHYNVSDGENYYYTLFLKSNGKWKKRGKDRSTTLASSHSGDKPYSENPLVNPEIRTFQSEAGVEFQLYYQDNEEASGGSEHVIPHFDYNPQDGTPDYINVVKKSLKKSANKFAEHFDITNETINVYLLGLRTGVFGEAGIWDEFDGHYIWLDNNHFKHFENKYWDDGKKPELEDYNKIYNWIRTDIAHELFHIVQNSYAFDIYEAWLRGEQDYKKWIIEGTPEWASDLVFNELDSYTTFRDFPPRHDDSLTAVGERSYESVYYWQFFSDHFVPTSWDETDDEERAGTIELLLEKTGDVFPPRGTHLRKKIGQVIEERTPDKRLMELKDKGQEFKKIFDESFTKYALTNFLKDLGDGTSSVKASNFLYDYKEDENAGFKNLSRKNSGENSRFYKSPFFKEWKKQDNKWTRNGVLAPGDKITLKNKKLPNFSADYYGMTVDPQVDTVTVKVNDFGGLGELGEDFALAVLFIQNTFKKENDSLGKLLKGEKIPNNPWIATTQPLDFSDKTEKGEFEKTFDVSGVSGLDELVIVKVGLGSGKKFGVKIGGGGGPETIEEAARELVSEATDTIDTMVQANAEMWADLIKTVYSNIEQKADATTPPLIRFAKEAVAATGEAILEEKTANKFIKELAQEIIVGKNDQELSNINSKMVKDVLIDEDVLGANDIKTGIEENLTNFLKQIDPSKDYKKQDVLDYLTDATASVKYYRTQYEEGWKNAQDILDFTSDAAGAVKLAIAAGGIAGGTAVTVFSGGWGAPAGAAIISSSLAASDAIEAAEITGRAAQIATAGLASGQAEENIHEIGRAVGGVLSRTRAAINDDKNPNPTASISEFDAPDAVALGKPAGTNTTIKNGSEEPIEAMAAVNVVFNGLGPDWLNRSLEFESQAFEDSDEIGAGASKEATTAVIGGNLITDTLQWISPVSLGSMNVKAKAKYGYTSPIVKETNWSTEHKIDIENPVVSAVKKACSGITGWLTDDTQYKSLADLATQQNSQNIKVALKVKNSSNKALNDVVVTDTLPKDLVSSLSEVNFLTPYSSASESTLEVEWELDLAPNETRYIEYIIANSGLAAGDSYTLPSVKVSATDPNTGSKDKYSSLAKTQVIDTAKVALSITGVTSPDRVLGQGEEFQISATIENLGTETANGAEAIIHPPEGVSVIGKKAIRIGDLQSNNQTSASWRLKGTTNGEYSLRIETHSSGSNGDMTTVSVRVASESKTTQLVEGWNLLSAPGKPMNTAPEDSLGDDIEGNFSLSYWDGDMYLVHPQDELKIEGNKGYWLRVGQSDGIEVDMVVYLTTASSTTLEQTGWHMIGTPFPIKWGDVKVNGTKIKKKTKDSQYSGGQYSGPLYKYVFSYDPRTGYSFARAESWEYYWLRPWYGYWVYTKEPDVKLTFEKGASSSSASMDTKAMARKNENLLTANPKAHGVKSPPKPPEDLADKDQVSPLKVTTSRKAAASAIEFSTPAEGIKRIKVDIFNLSGSKLYSSGFTKGGSLEWKMETNGGEKVSNGIYLYEVTAKTASGKLRQSKTEKLLILN